MNINRHVGCGVWVMLALVVTAQAAMVIDNFNTGTLSGWDKSSGYMTLTNVSSPTYEGAGAMQVTWDDWNQGWWENITKTFPSQDWSNYGTLQIALKTDASAAGTVIINYFDSGAWHNGWGSSIGTLDLSLSGGNYAVYSIPLGTAARSSVTEILFSWDNQYVNGTTTMYLDTIQVVPEPVSGALLALGGLLLLRRRR